MQIPTLPKEHAIESTARARESRATRSRQRPPPFPPAREKSRGRLPTRVKETSLPLLKEAIDEQKLLLSGIASPPAPLATDPPSAFSAGAIAAVELPSEVMELFEKSVNAMAHQTSSGVSETTFYLDSLRFEGAKVVITEFSTAPKVFNISMIGSAEAAALFHLHAADLLAAFQKSPFHFSVHRLESEIDVHPFDRKENVGEEQEERQQ